MSIRSDFRKSFRGPFLLSSPPPIAGEINSDSVNFPGDAWLERGGDLEGVQVTAQTLLFDANFSLDAAGMGVQQTLITTSGSNLFNATKQANGRLRVRVRDDTNSGNTYLLDVGDPLAFGVDYRLIVSVDTVADGMTAVILNEDGTVHASVNSPTPLGVTLAPQSGNWIIGANNGSGANAFTGGLRTMSLWIGSYADAALPATHALLLSNTDADAQLGAPILRLQGSAIVTGTNTGTGGNLSPSGAGSLSVGATPLTGTSVEVFGKTYTFNETVTYGYALSGIAWVLSTPTLELISVSDPTTTLPNLDNSYSHVINGMMLNPEATGFAPLAQGWDERAGGYVPALNVDLSSPLSLSAGDTLYAAQSDTSFQDDPATTRDNREGSVAQYSVLHVVSQAWSAETFAPTAFHWAGKAEHPDLPIDLDAYLARVSTRNNGQPFDLSTVDLPTPAEVIERMGQIEPWGKGHQNNSQAGYETITTRDFTDVGEPNYGGDIAAWLEAAAYHLIGNIATPAERRELVIWLIQNGICLYQAIIGSGVPVRPEGAHSRFQLFCIMTFLDAYGMTAEILDLENTVQTNVLGQHFRMTQAFADTLVRHTDPAGPHTWRERTITSVNGLDLTLSYIRNNNVNDPAQVNWDQLILTRVSDGATAVISMEDNFNGPSGGVPGHVPLSIDGQPTTPFAVGDVVYMETPEPIPVGVTVWTIDPVSANFYNPSPKAVYFNNNRKAGIGMFTSALLGGLPDTDGWNRYRELMESCNRTNYPTAAFDWPHQYGDRLTLGGRTYDATRTFWNQYATILGMTDSIPSLVASFNLNDAYFDYGVGVPANTTKMTFRSKFRLRTATASTAVLFGQRSSSRYALNAGLRGRFAGLQDGAGTSIGTNGEYYDYELNSVYENTLTFDLENQELVETINGATFPPVPLTIADDFRFMQTADNRRPLAFALNGGGGSSFPADTEIEYMAFEITTNGVDTVIMSADAKVETPAQINAKPYVQGTVVATP